MASSASSRRIGVTPASPGAGADREVLDHSLELLSSLGAVQPKRMFGGWGLYLDGVMFALIANEELYLKVDETALPQWQAAGGHPFVYEARRRRVSLSYWTAPAEALESPALMRPWARLALEAALRQRARTPAKQPDTRRAARGTKSTAGGGSLKRRKGAGPG